MVPVLSRKRDQISRASKRVLLLSACASSPCKHLRLLCDLVVLDSCDQTYFQGLWPVRRGDSKQS
jgi:hypothetical protein